MSSTVVALPRDGGGDNPDGSGGGSSDPVERPPRPPRKPQIPGFVLFNGAYYRETTLPLCEWGSGDRSFYSLFMRLDHEPADPWTCLGDGVPSYNSQTGEYLNDTCSFSGPPDFRPNDGPKRGQIFYWNHEEEGDETYTYDNLYFVAASLDDLLAGLYD